MLNKIKIKSAGGGATFSVLCDFVAHAEDIDQDLRVTGMEMYIDISSPKEERSDGPLEVLYTGLENDTYPYGDELFLNEVKNYLMTLRRQFNRIEHLDPQIIEDIQWSESGMQDDGTATFDAFEFGDYLYNVAVALGLTTRSN